MNPEISIVLPGIRNQKWDFLYESIFYSTKRTFEMIVCGPYPLTEKLQKQKNVKYVKDWGSPVRASNIAAMLSEGKVITWVADDALFLDSALDLNIDLLYSMGNSEKNVVVCKYYEGENLESSPEKNPIMSKQYYKINNSHNFSPYLNNNWLLFNVAVMHRSYFDYLGGWNSKYEGTAMSHNDFAVRAQYDGAKILFSETPLIKCEHLPGSTGDHGPIFECQHGHDEPLYQSTYRDPDWYKNVDIRLDLDKNWKTAPIVWNRRFKHE